MSRESNGSHRFDDGGGGGAGQKLATAVSRREVWSMVASRLYFSRAYILFYALMIVLSIVAIVMLLATHYLTSAYTVPPLLVALEIILNVFLTLEIAVRYVSQKDEFWKNNYNVFDLLVTLLCLFSVVCFLFIPEETEVEEVFVSWVVIGRYAIQSFRICLLFRAGRTRTMVQGSYGMEIEFSRLERRDSESGLFQSREQSDSMVDDELSPYEDDDELPMSSFDLARLGNAVLRQTGLDEAGAKDQTTAKGERTPPHRARGNSCVATQEFELVIEEDVGAGRKVVE